MYVFLYWVFAAVSTIETGETEEDDEEKKKKKNPENGTYRITVFYMV